MQSAAPNNNLLLSISKSKNLVFDIRKNEAKTHTPVYISGAEVEQVNSLKFLGINITENLSWTSHISTLVKKNKFQRSYISIHSYVLKDKSTDNFLF